MVQGRRSRPRLRDDGVKKKDRRRGVATAAATTVMSSWPGQRVAALTAATAVRLLPRPSVSSHWRGSRLLSFLK